MKHLAGFGSIGSPQATDTTEKKKRIPEYSGVSTRGKGGTPLWKL